MSAHIAGTAAHQRVLHIPIREDPQAQAPRESIMTAMGGRGTSLATRAVRMAGTALLLLRGLLTAAVMFPFFPVVRRRRAIRNWSQALLRMLGVRLRVHGTAPDATVPAMLVANHVSWLDIFVINTVLPVRFIAKSEIRSWPAIGWLSAKAGTLFIARARRHDTARVNREVAAAMRAGDVIAVFPEGMTTDGSRVLRFHSSLLQPALLAGAHVYPVALRFERGDGGLCVEAAYDGDKSLWATFLQVIAQPAINAQLWFLPPLPPGSTHRRELADAAQQLIADRLRS